MQGARYRLDRGIREETSLPVSGIDTFSPAFLYPAPWKNGSEYRCDSSLLNLGIRDVLLFI
jgi:hypothetical protein